MKHVAPGTRTRVTPYAFGSRATAETQLAPLLRREKSRPARRRNGSENLPPFDTTTFFKLKSFGAYRISLIREIVHSFFKKKGVNRDEEEYGEKSARLVARLFGNPVYRFDSMDGFRVLPAITSRLPRSRVGNRKRGWKKEV